MTEKEINITYETLFDLLRREKNRPELQKLSDSFVNDLKSYIKEKNSILKGQQIKIGDSAEIEKENTEKQIDNIKSMLNNLFDRRQQKIVQMAIIKAKTSSNPDDCSALLDEEKKLFNQLSDVLSGFRQSLLSEIYLVSETYKKKQPEEEPEQENKENLENVQEDKQEENQEKQQKKDEKTKLIRFINSVPRFVGRNLEVYGPFEEDDTANLPEEIADILTMKQRAEEIKK
ncbi:MAG: hypothetical protein PHV16_02990 [Candidatus Nanoarchaeia archaeon]|nr:hypothetical protein [Candidatus Nanoarchaeia archaeon]